LHLKEYPELSFIIDEKVDEKDNLGLFKMFGDIGKSGGKEPILVSRTITSSHKITVRMKCIKTSSYEYKVQTAKIDGL
jgi:hypothetical protein